jgi:hypothetical protein
VSQARTPFRLVLLPLDCPHGILYFLSQSYTHMFTRLKSMSSLTPSLSLSLPCIHTCISPRSPPKISASHPRSSLRSSSPCSTPTRAGRCARRASSSIRFSASAILRQHSDPSYSCTVLFWMRKRVFIMRVRPTAKQNHFLFFASSRFCTDFVLSEMRNIFLCCSPPLIICIPICCLCHIISFPSLHNQPLLTIVGALIGSSGAFLTRIMCEVRMRGVSALVLGLGLAE